MREWLYRKLWRVRRVRTQAEAMRSIRDHYRALGIPVDHLSDEELTAAIVRFGRAMSNVGIPVREAMANMAASFRAMDAALHRSRPLR